MSIPQSDNTQSERMAQELKALNSDVTAKDREVATEELRFSKQTISRYLNGNVLDNDTAISLLLFFRKRISDREILLTGTTQTEKV